MKGVSILLATIFSNIDTDLQSMTKAFKLKSRGLPNKKIMLKPTF